MTSTSTVGLPRLSSISRPMMSVMAVMDAFPDVSARFYRRGRALSCPAASAMTALMAKKTLQLGRPVRLPASPDKAQLDRVPNPHPDTDYVARFTAPEFTSLCPVTGQPDFAHFVIDYAPGRWLLESKSLKLYLASFRNHGAFHEDCTVAIGKRIADAAQAEMAAHRRLLVSARRHSDRRVLADRQAAERRLGAGPGRGALSRPRLGRPFQPSYPYRYDGGIPRLHLEGILHHE